MISRRDKRHIHVNMTSWLRRLYDLLAPKTVSSHAFACGILLLIIYGLLSSCLYAANSAADKDFHTLTAQFHALAPNAGGQQAYRLEWYQNYRAYSLFNDRSLMIGKNTLFGAGYSVRLPVCDSSCFWQFFTQVGWGISNAGPFGEITWGTVIPFLPLWLPTSSPKYLPAARIDITSQFYASRTRIIAWSYPIWAGISISF